MTNVLNNHNEKYGIFTKKSTLSQYKQPLLL